MDTAGVCDGHQKKSVGVGDAMETPKRIWKWKGGSRKTSSECYLYYFGTRLGDPGGAAGGAGPVWCYSSSSSTLGCLFLAAE
jgi:hypothetical protein